VNLDGVVEFLIAGAIGLAVVLGVAAFLLRRQIRWLFTENDPEAPPRTGRERAGGISCALAAVVLVIVNDRTGRLGMPSAGAAVEVAAAITLAVQLFTSLVARGRAMPGLRFMPGVRIGLALVGLAAAVHQLRTSPPPGGSPAPGELAPFVAVSLVVLVLAETSARLRGPSVALACFVVQFVASSIKLQMLGGPSTLLAGEIVAFVSLVAVVAAVRALRLTRTRLARLGIVPWAPSELALIPSLPASALIFAIVVSFGPLGDSIGWIMTGGYLLSAGAVVLALRYLDRRLRAAEAYHAARQAPAVVE
jgi:hypothetical protein